MTTTMYTRRCINVRLKKYTSHSFIVINNKTLFIHAIKINKDQIFAEVKMINNTKRDGVERATNNQIRLPNKSKK
jgi:hypothetical protein